MKSNRSRSPGDPRQRALFFRESGARRIVNQLKTRRDDERITKCPFLSIPSLSLSLSWQFLFVLCEKKKILITLDSICGDAGGGKMTTARVTVISEFFAADEGIPRMLRTPLRTRGIDAALFKPPVLLFFFVFFLSQALRDSRSSSRSSNAYKSRVPQFPPAE